MSRLNRDTLVAIFLLLFCGVMFWASFDIKSPDYGQLSPATWPRVILGLLTFLVVIYLVQSIAKGQGRPEGREDEPTTLVGWISYWRNPFACFALFLTYLLMLPYFGMLIAGVVFVFILLNVLGGWQPKALAVHAMIALVAVGGMWSLFTYALEVFLPTGSLLEGF